MAKDWIERQNAAFAAQAKNFANKIASDFEAYGISPSDAALLSADYAVFAGAFSLAGAPATRTRGTVCAAKQARKTLVARMRDIGGRIRANRSISDAARIGLTLTVPGSAGVAPDAAPNSPPSVLILNAVNNLITVRLQDENTPSRRTRPRGVVGAQLFYMTGKHESPDVNNWRPAGVATSSKATIALPYVPPGTKVWIAARWFDGRGRSGPLSLGAHKYLGEMVIATTSIAA